ncbi:phage tail tape measure protein, partial [Patescibacteria group bacterium]|nr:phage tail tape measure protein [Patescibacteria group bacterium]
MPERQVKIIVTAEDRTARVLGGVQKNLQSVSQALTSVGKKMTLGLTLPIVGFGTAAAKMAGDFESKMAIMTIAARSSGTALADLEKAAITTGADIQLVGIDAVQAADAMTAMYKAGLTTADIFGGPEGLNHYLEKGTGLTGALRAAIDLAAASDLDLAASTDTVTIAMATFGIGADEATRISNNLVAAADASVTEVGDLA